VLLQEMPRVKIAAGNGLVPAVLIQNPDVLMMSPARIGVAAMRPNFCVRRKSGASLSGER